MSAQHLTVFVIVSLVTVKLGQGACPQEFPVSMPNSASCFAIITDTKKNFADSQSYCQNIQVPSGYNTATLAVVDNENTQTTLALAIGSKAEKLWIGLSESFTDWYWVPSNTPIGAQGCYLLNRMSDDSLDRTPFSTITNLTNLKCQEACKNESYKYAGIYTPSNEAVCKCGNKFVWDNDGAVTQGCDEKPCVYDPSQYCGGQDRMKVYQVRDGSPVSIWKGDEPNNYDHYSKCLTITAWGQRKWGDRKCGQASKTGHICQFPLSKSACMAMGYYYYHDASATCYGLTPNSNLAWFEARMKCMENNGDLIEILSTDLQKDIVSRSVLKDEDPLKDWWIGGKAIVWKWDDVPLGSYSNWDKTNPNNPEGHCVVIHVNSGGGVDADKKYKWEDIQCDDHFNFICGTRPTPTTTSTTTTKTKTPTRQPTPTAGTSKTPESSTRRPGINEAAIGGDTVIFTNGVIVAIVIASAAVLVATIRLLVYCCQRRNQPRTPGRPTIPYSKGAHNPSFTYDTMAESPASPDSPKPLEDVEVGNDTYARVNKGPDNNSSNFGY